jgi:F-type H+-transporting ATPase subunit delta
LTKAKELVGNKSINLETKIDESLVGGFILRVGDVQVDASIATQLKKLKRELVEK